jgi:class 3 adenylate cyclase
VGAGGLPEAPLRISAGGWSREEPCLAPRPTLFLENATEDEHLLILEHLAWSDQAATAAEVTTLQRFRDLFASEALRPGLQLSVGSLAVVFTDLRGSTRLYRDIGDGAAFGRVMDHFEVLREAIAAEDGAVVKTIGDAVMAAFRQPGAALRAIIRAQQVLASPTPGKLPLHLKAGIHYGSCIAVNLNDRLDYFGATINIAARLVGLSSGEDVVISAAVRDDPEVAEWLAATDGMHSAEPIEATLKGYDAERFALWRVAPGSGTPRTTDPKA